MTTLLNPPRFRAQQAEARHAGNGRQQARHIAKVNVGEKERDVSMAAGAILAAQGLSRGSVTGLLTAAVGGFMIYRGATGHCAVYEALDLDTQHAGGKPQRDPIEEKGVHVEQSMLVDKPAGDLYAFWHDFENFPRFMSHLVSVKRLDDRRSHWVAKGLKLIGGQVEWEAEITADEPNTRIAWRSLPGSSVDTIGEVRFEKAPGDRGTFVHATMSYVPPAGKLGHLIARLFDSSPLQKMRDDLRSFKRLMELGELITTVGQSRGTCTGTGKRQEKL
jgi:uncharacterized membrane protein